MYACGRNQDALDAAGHAHPDDVVEQLTLFTDSSEFYVEYPELMAGHKVAFLVHITRLSSYKPYMEGSVRVTLDYGDKQSTGLAESPESPGIWRVLVRPEYAGDCKVLFEYQAENITENTDPQTAHVEDHGHEDTPEADTPAHAADHADEGDHADEEDHAGESPGGIQFTKEQAWKSNFSVDLIVPSPFSGIIKAGGEILAMPGEKYFIHASNPGIINYVKKNMVAGGNVKKGEEMLVIEGQNLTSSNITVNYAEAEASFIQSRSEYQRRLKLFSENAISERAFIETRATYVRDSIHYYNLKQSFTGSGMIIRSPIGGYIHELRVSQGEFVAEGQLIATVSSDQRLLLRADVSQQYFDRIRDIISTNFRTSYHPTVWDIEDLGGKLIAVGSSVEENNQYLPVYFEANNNGELLEGAYAEFYLKTRVRENSIIVPVSAVLEEQGSYYVYIQVSGETYQKRSILPDQSDGVSLPDFRWIKFWRQSGYQGAYAS